MNDANSEPDGWLSDDDFSKIITKVPLACVDFVPVRRSPSGTVTQIGLILRNTPFGVPRWCHLGGRVRYGETLAAALRRHADEAFGPASPVIIAASLEAATIYEWFPQVPSTPDYPVGHDPRKHAISLGFVLEVCGELAGRAQGEALDFGWFAPADLASLALWPGAAEFLRRLLAREHRQPSAVPHLPRSRYRA